MHTFTASGKTDITAVITAMLSSLGTTRQCDDCLVFDRHGRAYTSAWRLAGGGWGVSFRHASSGPDRAYYRTAWDAALAVRAGEHNEAAYISRKMDGRPTGPPSASSPPHSHRHPGLTGGQAGAARPGLAR